jgi:tRNA(Ile)-lysidine synthetase-like protein
MFLKDPLLLAVRESRLLRPGDRVLAAVSGGPDSTALLLALHDCGYDVVVAHYDHALRAGSDVVARQVAEVSGRLGVPLITERRTTPLPKGSVQSAAREIRYAFLDRARIDSGATVVAIAHTADDLVEGVALHLLRGCGLAGFRGMPAKRGHYVRPLLDVWRSEVVEFLRQRQIVAHEDPANTDTNFARVRARHDLLPALEGDRPGILQRFHAAALNVARWHQSAADQAAKALQSGPLAAADLEQMPEAVAVEALKLIYTRAGGPEPGLSRTHFELMLRLAKPGRGGRGVDLPGGMRFRIVGGLMQVVASPNRQSSPQIEVSNCSGCDDPGVAHVRAGLQLSVGHRRPGLRMRPVGGRGTRKLQDIFVDARVPREERDQWPLVFAGENLAWVPGIALDADAAGTPGEASVHLTLSPMPARSQPKVARLGTPKSPPGEPT